MSGQLISVSRPLSKVTAMLSETGVYTGACHRILWRSSISQSEIPNLLSAQVYASTFYHCRANLGHVRVVVRPIESQQASHYTQQCFSEFLACVQASHVLYC